MKTIGVSFGYADPGELEEYGAEFIADSAESLQDYILRLR